MARLEAERVQAGFPAGLTPRDHGVFRGVVVLDGVPWWGRLFYRVVSGPGGDHRDWHRVEGWAACIAAGLTADELS